MTKSKQELGQLGEQMAARFLIARDYDIVTRNFRTRKAELDLIAWHEKPHHGRTLCFIEVKTRQTDNGSAERAHNVRKLQHVMLAAQAFCLRHGIDMDAVPIQFEHVSVYIQERRVRHFVLPVN